MWGRDTGSCDNRWDVYTVTVAVVIALLLGAAAILTEGAPIQTALDTESDRSAGAPDTL